jgi:predicted site-specific integrase-resolvase
MLGKNKERAGMFLTVQQAARLLHVCLGSIRYYERTGKLCAVKLETGERLFLSMEIERFLSERRKARLARARRKKRGGQ